MGRAQRQQAGNRKLPAFDLRMMEMSALSVFNLDSGQATAITGGVGEALIATAFGLCIAILALLVHSYFVQRIENVVTDMEQSFSLMEEHQEEMRKVLRTEVNAKA